MAPGRKRTGEGCDWNYPPLAAHPQKEEHHSLHNEGRTQLSNQAGCILQAGKAAGRVAM